MKRATFIILWLILAAVGTRGVVSADGPQPGVAVLPAVADVTVSYYEPDSNFNGTPVIYNQDLVYDADGSGWCPTVVHMMLLQFDLSGVDFAVDKARLKLMPLDSASGTQPEFFVSYFDNAWDESTVTWNTMPESALPGLYLGQPAQDGMGYWTWTDDDPSQFGYTLAEDLAARSDDLLTLTLLLPMGTGCDANPPDANPLDYVFADGTSLTPPTLELASAVDDLPNPVPTALTLSSIATTGAASSLAMVITFVCLLIGSGAWLARKQA